MSINISDYKTGVLNGHKWIRIPYEHTTHLSTHMAKQYAGQYVIIFMFPDVKDFDASNIKYGNESIELYTPFRISEIEKIKEDENDIIKFRGFPKYNLESLLDVYPIPDDLKGWYDIHRITKKLIINFRTINRSGVEVTKSYKIDTKNFILDELEKAYSWARKNAPKPAEQEMKVSSFTNGILAIGDDIALQGFREGQFETARDAYLRLPGSHFGSDIITEVTFTKSPKSNRVMTKIKCGSSYIEEDESGVTVLWQIAINESAAEGLKGSDLGDVISERWAKGMTIRKAETTEEVANNKNNPEIKKFIKIRSGIVYESLNLPKIGFEVDYKKSAAKSIENILRRDIKITESLKSLIDIMDDKQKSVLFSEMLNEDITYIVLSNVGLNGWVVEKSHYSTYKVSNSPELEKEDLQKYLTSMI